MSQTIIDLIDQLKPRRQSSLSLRKQSSSSQSSVLDQIDEQQYYPEEDNSPNGWTHKQSLIFEKLIKIYGADFTIIQNHLPGFSRKQIKKKFDKLENIKELRKTRLEGMRRDKLKRSIFEDDILEIVSEEAKANLQSKPKQKQPYK